MNDLAGYVTDVPYVYGFKPMLAPAWLDLVAIIGGVTPERIPALLAEAAIHGVAAITALWHAADPADAARRMLKELNG